MDRAGDDERDELVEAGDVATADLAGLNFLCRAVLAARRRQEPVAFSGVSPRLRELVDFAGLKAVVRFVPPSVVEVGGESEQREEARGVEEERDPADPIA